jgi:hypothetical protein
VGAGVRLPTPPEQAYAWHNNALKGVYGDDIVINPDEPQCGWYQRRLVKRGPLVPARIWLFGEIDIGTGELVDQEIFQCEVNGERADAFDQWSYLAANPIPESVFHYLTALAAYVRDHQPSHPLANPRQPIDLLTAPLPHFTTRKDAHEHR